MNKNDVKLVIILILISIIVTLFISFTKKDGEIADVYYENKLILSINLNSNDEYTVNGFNGEVKLKVKDKKIKVITENSPLHLCSKQGYISSSNESIVCLPNKIVIKIKNDKQLDTVIG